MAATTLSVKQLNTYVKSLLESDVRLSFITVKGEISNLKNHYSSGHIYFTLKDNDAAIRAVMFKGYATTLKFKPEDGMQVVVTGRVSLYEKDGSYQFYAESMVPDGIGDIAALYEKVKEKLQKEGLFEAESKRPIPKFPKTVAVITSDTGAAVRDILNILSRRYPLCDILMCPVAVQGENAVPTMIDALDRVYALSKADLIIIGRGGGSIEDLWAFNDERLARKIYESPIPVISAVGHETDFTICDFVADLRAPTPSAAAELAVPDVAELGNKINRFENIILNNLLSKYKYSKARLDAVLENGYFKNPLEKLVFYRSEMLDKLTVRAFDSIRERVLKSEKQLISSVARLDTLNPAKVMLRGFSVVKSNEKTVKSVNDVNLGDDLNITLSDGNINCKVTDKEKKNG